MVIAVALALIANGVGFGAGTIMISPLPIVVGAFLLGAGVTALFRPRRSPGLRTQDVMIGSLLSAVRDLPDGWQAMDPVTGQILQLRRDRGMITLVVVEPLSDDPVLERAAMMTYYLLGGFGRPVPAPLNRYVAPLHEQDGESMPWRQARQELKMADMTGTAYATPEELAELHDLALRVITRSEPDQ
ncbi:hypothetical protein [Streptosporangium subroseum]|uniref:hypothetical protein n=1 Tax=Streptosporangium subroseum TaxID=106412 RepID=UPI00117FAA93|nr:hypothetical protein [Streptosporangium subroseum]